MVRDRTGRPTGWTRALVWIGAGALVVAAAHFLPAWAAITLAIAVFGARILLAPGCDACHLPREGRRGVTKAAPPDGR